MSLARPRRKPIFHRAKNPWPVRLKGLAVAGFALAAVISFKIAAAGADDARLGSSARAAEIMAPELERRSSSRIFCCQ